jgi:limonene 1,2-monooxygenase
MVQTVDWAQREHILHSFELLARYVMPVFQGTTLSTAASNKWSFEHREVLSAGRVQAIDRAKTDYATRS